MLVIRSRGKFMSKRVSAILGIALLSAPGIAAAKDKQDSRLQAMLECESVSASEARLQCYDQAVAALKPAVAQGTVVVKEKNAPVTLGGVVKASGASGGNRFWLELENGDRWALLPGKTRREPPPPGTTVKVSRTLMGSYYVSAPNWPQSEAKFLGNGS
jgi:hypothetical protein